MTAIDRAYRFYNQSADYLQRLEDAGWRPEYGAVLGALKRYSMSGGGAALDFGCGVGDLTATLRHAGLEVVGADVSLPAIRSARARHPHLAFVALDAGPMLPFAACHFWSVVAANSIEHVSTPARTLRELHRVLMPGGLLVLTFPNLLSPLRPLKRFLVRPKRARYGPESGDNTGESLELMIRNASLLLNMRLSRQPQFRSRQPDFANAERYRLLGYGADYDAAWLCNPLDIAYHLRRLGMHILEMRGIADAAERSMAFNRLRRILPASITSPILLVARKTF